MSGNHGESRSFFEGRPCFIIAEAGVNHNGDFDLALKLVDAAADAGADAVKFQTFRSKSLVTAEAPKASYQESRSSGKTQLEMLQQLELSQEQHRHLKQHCEERGVMFMSTPFEQESARFLDELGVEVFKVPSGEVTNLPFLEYLAGFGRPLVVSTGMCSLGEVEAAVQTIEATGNRDLALLHCVSNYPADPADVNLKAMDTLGAAFGYPVGYSDHTLGIAVGSAAVARGAVVLEKHYTLDCSLPGPDHSASLEPPELEQLIRSVRTIEESLGNGRKIPVAAETATAAVARKSLVAARDIVSGERLTEEVISIKRPGTGLPPSMRPFLVDRVARQDIPAGSLLRLENVA